MERSDIELVAIEYIEEVVNAGAAKLMTSSDLATFVSELVIGNIQEAKREELRPFTLQTVQMLLLPEQCKKRGIEIDHETTKILRDALR